MTDLIYTSSAANQLGISDNVFLRLTNKYNINPVEVIKNRYQNYYKWSEDQLALIPTFEIEKSKSRIRKLAATKAEKQTVAEFDRELNFKTFAFYEQCRLEQLITDGFDYLQLVALNQLDLDQLIERAKDAMHSLNREAKSYKRYDEEQKFIYKLKDEFLKCLLDHNLATVKTFQYRHIYDCRKCLEDWDFGYCRCKDEMKTWYLIDSPPYSFHSPKLEEKYIKDAIAIPSHNPTQGRKDIPDIGLRNNVRKYAVQLMIKKMNEEIK